MTSHLSPQQFADAADGNASPVMQAHLDTCPACAARVSELRAMVGRLTNAADVPEPSPLFWDHFSARVAAAVDATPAPTPAWWPRWWRQVVAVGAMAAVATVVVLLRWPHAPEVLVSQPASVVRTAADARPAPDPGAAIGNDASVTTDEPWNLIVALAGTLPHEDLHELVPPAHGTAGLVDDLTPEQRAAFVQLVKQQMGGTE